MKIHILIGIIFSFVIFQSCRKDDNANPQAQDGSITETVNGITYKLYKPASGAYKGIVVMGSGNNENNPTEGGLDGAAENDFCKKASENGYLAAIVKYRKTPGVADWNASAVMLNQDYKTCIEGIATKYSVDKAKSVVGGFSYASYLLLTANSIDNSLTFCKGILAACGATSTWSAQNFKIPIYAINCSGNNEGDFNGLALYSQIPNNSPIKAKSGGVTDNSCNSHCGGNWTNLMITRLQYWLP
jgi:hypothetical protein